MQRILESRLRQIENDLSKSLSKMELPPNQQIVKTIIRDKALQISQIGIRYVCDFFGIDPFMAAEDFSYIGKITDDTYRIWAYGGKLDSALIALTSITLAKAIKSKALQIITDYPVMVYTSASATADSMHMKTIEKKLPVNLQQDLSLEEIAFSMKDTTKSDSPSLFLVWVTEMDALVCPICEALKGQQWELDDPTALTPVEDTHPNCRCRVELQNITADDNQ